MKNIFTFILSVSCVLAFYQSSYAQNVKNNRVQKAGVVDLENAEQMPAASQIVEMPKQGYDRPTSGPKVSYQSYKLEGVTDLSKATNDFNPTLLQEMPKQGPSKMVPYNYPEKQPAAKQRPSSPTLPTPVKGMSFLGNHFNVSTPCDNDFAISDSGFAISVMNTTIFFRDVISGVTYLSKTLGTFTHPINKFHKEFDPKVIYDPDNDRFILVCLVGNVDSTSKVVVGFSQTNKGNGPWNLYMLPGDALNNNLWSDYPMIALTKNELFLSLNLLYNDSTWQAGFVETIVWQINKKNGYLGQSLNTALHSGIGYNGKAIRNLCPVKGGSKLNSPNMYFISNRNLASQNDTVFLVNITDTIGSSTATVTTKALVSNQPYYFPPDGRQSMSTQSLATNDSRNLGAFIENNIIQYVHNTKNPLNNQPTIYYGVIDSVSATTPTVTGYIIPNDTMDFAYPNISYAGLSNTDNTSIITFDHSSPKVNAGVSAMRADGTGSFSNILRIANGLSHVNLLTSNLERWGDYSGSQRRYSRPGEVWMSGYYGYNYSSGYPNSHAAWIAQINPSSPPITTGNERKTWEDQTNVYPNPASTRFEVSFHLNKPEYLSFQLFDAQGKLIKLLLRDWVKTEQNTFGFDTKELERGVYILTITGNYSTNINKKLVIQ